MKKVFFLVIVLASTSAFATKARMTALGSSFHLQDPQSFFSNPLQTRSYKSNLIELESGSSTATTNKNGAEGIALYHLSDTGKVAVSLGRVDDIVQVQRTFMNAVIGGSATYKVPQSMLSAVYGHTSGDDYYAFGIFASNENDKLNSTTESSNGIIAGMRMANGFGVYANLGLTNEVKAAGGLKFDGAGYSRLSLRYKTTESALNLAFDIYNWASKSSTNGTENHSFTTQIMRASILKAWTTETGEIFMGGQLSSTGVDCKVTGSATCTTKFTRTNLPVWIGVEANANDWMVLRGSITQSVLYDTSKDEIGLPTTAGISGATGAASEFGNAPNNTVVAAGTGFKFKGARLDATLSSATSQSINTTALLAQVGFNYTF